MSKKYYWLKLKNDFFERKDIKIIEAMDNGKDYIIFLLKLKLRSLEENGYLRVSETIPYNNKLLSTITNTDIDIVKSAMELFIEFGLIEVMDNDTIYMRCVQQLIGSETDAAKRMRDHRKKQDLKQLPKRNIVTTKLKQCNTEKDKDKKLDKKKDKKEDMFNEFWDFYPRKISKTDTKNAFMKQIKINEYNNFIKAVLNYKNYIVINKIEDKFIKHGSTFINKDRWKEWFDFKGENNEKNIGTSNASTQGTGEKISDEEIAKKYSNNVKFI
jgi:predicted phage replisome organizer